MHELDEYIGSIISSLRISKMKKEELKHEFLDHLELLKSEYMGNGLTDKEATQKAIETFGDSKKLNKNLRSSFSSYRKPSNIIFGVFILLIDYLFFSCLPVIGACSALIDFNANLQSLPYSFYIFLAIAAFEFFIPIGYFIPIIFGKDNKLTQLVIIYSTVGLLTWALFSFIVINTLSLKSLVLFLTTGLAGGMTGYILLQAFTNICMLIDNYKTKLFGRTV